MRLGFGRRLVRTNGLIRTRVRRGPRARNRITVDTVRRGENVYTQSRPPNRVPVV